MAGLTDKILRMHSTFRYTRKEADALARKTKGVVIQVLRGRQWIVASRSDVIEESMKRMREANDWQGFPPPKIVKDFRK